MSNTPSDPDTNGTTPGATPPVPPPPPAASQGTTPPPPPAQNNGMPAAPGAPYPSGNAQYSQNPGFQGQDPYGMPGQGEPPRKKKTGLIIGIIAVAVIIVLVLAFLLFNKGGANAKYSSSEDFNQKISKATNGTSLEHCAAASDTLLESSLESSLSDQPFGIEDIYVCSNVDLTSYEALLNVDSSNEPEILMGVYSGDENVTEDSEKLKSLAEDFESSDSNWIVYGKNWVVVGANSSNEVKEKVLKKVGGKELTQK